MQAIPKTYLTLRHKCERITQNVPVKKSINLFFKAYAAEHTYTKLTCGL